MEYIPVIIIVCLTIVICIALDKLYKLVFRNKIQHKIGSRVKLSKRYGTIGLILLTLGIAALFAVGSRGWIAIVAGVGMILIGICLVVYFLSFGIYYDDESFIYSSFAKKSRTYTFAQIVSQTLYVNGAGVILELHLSEDDSIQLQSSMVGFNQFMNQAFKTWSKKNGIDESECSFYDPQKFSWFPEAKEE